MFTGGMVDSAHRGARRLYDDGLLHRVDIKDSPVHVNDVEGLMLETSASMTPELRAARQDGVVYELTQEEVRRIMNDSTSVYHNFLYTLFSDGRFDLRWFETPAGGEQDVSFYFVVSEEGTDNPQVYFLSEFLSRDANVRGAAYLYQSFDDQGRPVRAAPLQTRVQDAVGSDGVVRGVVEYKNEVDNMILGHEIDNPELGTIGKAYTAHVESGQIYWEPAEE